MADTDKERAVDLGIYSRPAPVPDFGTGEKIALAGGAVWVLASGLYLFLSRGDGSDASALRPALALLTMILPAGLICVGALVMRAARLTQAEAARLHIAMESIRHAVTATQKAAASGAPQPELTRKLGEIAEAQRKTETALATFISIRPHAPPPPAPSPPRPDEQASLALGTPAETMTPPVETLDFIAALQFPESPEDKEGFRALRRALQDRSAAQLIQAAQDVLTLLSQDGIYMDDLKPDRARPETWRRFAQGERGRAVASLGGIRDRSSLALSAARMRNDMIFRDACHHFLRKFDHTFAVFEKTASDADIVALSDTRTARAFMLLGRAAGTFD